MPRKKKAKIDTKHIIVGGIIAAVAVVTAVLSTQGDLFQGDISQVSGQNVNVKRTTPNSKTVPSNNEWTDLYGLTFRSTVDATITSISVQGYVDGDTKGEFGTATSPDDGGANLTDLVKNIAFYHQGKAVSKRINVNAKNGNLVFNNLNIPLKANQDKTIRMWGFVKEASGSEPDRFKFGIPAAKRITIMSGGKRIANASFKFANGVVNGKKSDSGPAIITVNTKAKLDPTINVFVNDRGTRQTLTGGEKDVSLGKWEITADDNVTIDQLIFVLRNTDPLSNPFTEIQVKCSGCSAPAPANDKWGSYMGTHLGIGTFRPIQAFSSSAGENFFISTEVFTINATKNKKVTIELTGDIDSNFFATYKDANPDQRLHFELLEINDIRNSENVDISKTVKVGPHIAPGVPHKFINHGSIATNIGASLNSQYHRALPSETVKPKADQEIYKLELEASSISGDGKAVFSFDGGQGGYILMGLLSNDTSANFTCSLVDQATKQVYAAGKQRQGPRRYGFNDATMEISAGSKKVLSFTCDTRAFGDGATLTPVLHEIGWYDGKEQVVATADDLQSFDDLTGRTFIIQR